MAEVVPEFFPGEGWEVEVDGAVLRANTLRALSAVLPPGTRIRDYYPGGYKHPGWGPGFGDLGERGLMRSELRTQHEGYSAALNRARAAAGQPPLRNRARARMRGQGVRVCSCKCGGNVQGIRLGARLWLYCDRCSPRRAKPWIVCFWGRWVSTCVAENEL
jgi:hypothetical protein